MAHKSSVTDVVMMKNRIRELDREIETLSRGANTGATAYRFAVDRLLDSPASAPTLHGEEQTDEVVKVLGKAMTGRSPEEQVRIVKRLLLRLDQRDNLQTTRIPGVDDVIDGLPEEARRAVLARMHNGASIGGGSEMHILARYTEEEQREAEAKYRVDIAKWTDGDTITMRPAVLARKRRHVEPPKYQRPNYGTLPERTRADLDRLENYMRTQVLVGRGDPGEMYLRAGAVWFDCGFRQRDDMDAFIAASRVLASVDAGPANEMLRADEAIDLHTAMFCGRWFASGAPRVRVSAPQAAALMLTDLPRDFVDADLRAPWAAFVVDLPNGLFPMGDGSDWARRVLVHRMHAFGEDVLWWLQVQGEATGVSVGRKSLCELQQEDELEAADEDGKNITIFGMRLRTTRETFARFAAMAKLVAGICYKLQEKPPVPIRSPGGGAIRRRPGGPPQTTETVLGFPVKVDFSNLVREHLLGHVKRLAKVQWLVRGHWRNQACGPQHSERRMTWIEPFWKGPLDAPILVRSHVFKEAPPA